MLSFGWMFGLVKGFVNLLVYVMWICLGVVGVFSINYLLCLLFFFVVLIVFLIVNRVDVVRNRGGLFIVLEEWIVLEFGVF